MVTSLVACLVLSSPVAEIKVQGEGFLRFAREGRIVYAKSSKLAVNSGKLTSATGEPMMPAIILPNDTAKIEVTLEGAVTAVLPNKQKVSGGQIVLAQFANENELQADGCFLVAQWRPKLVSPGDGTAGVIRAAGIDAETPVNQVPTNPIKSEPKKEVKTQIAPKQTGTTKPTPAYTGTPIIVFHEENEIAEEKYTIGDIASIKADASTEKLISELILGNTPAIGITNKVTRSSVVAALSRVNIKKDEVSIEMPAFVTVRRPSQNLTSNDFNEAAIAYAKKQVPDTVTFEGHQNGPDYVAPLGKAELRGEAFSIRNGTAEVTVGIYVDGKRRNSRTVSLDARGADGDFLQKIQAGTRVKIIVRSGTASITIFGKTKTAVFVGQSVEAVSDNRTTHIGILTDPSSVEVKI